MSTSFSWTVLSGLSPSPSSGSSATVGATAGSEAVRDLKLDRATDDLVLDETGDLILTEGIEAIADDLIARLRTFQGEWFLDLDLGFPWWDVLGQKPNLATVRDQVQAIALNTPGITACTVSATVGEDRTLAVVIECTADTGTMIQVVLSQKLGG